MSEPPPDRVYSEEEIGRILKRAASLQGKESSRPVLGLTLPELQQLAKESDIDPSYIAAAALELAGASSADESGFFGGPLSLTIRRRIDGAVSEDAFIRMVSEARRRFKKSGTTGVVGSTREWSIDNERDQSASFSLRERDGHTELEIFWSESDILPIPFIMIPFVLTIISLPIVGEELQLPFAWAALTVLTWMFVLATASRATFRTVTARHRRRVREFADVLVEIADQERARVVDSASREAPRTVEVRPVEPRITLEDPGERESDESGSGARVRER